MQNETAFPLHWPVTVPRTKRAISSQFDRRRSFEQSRRILFDELKRLGAQKIVLSTNLELRLDGYPYSNRRQPEDKGVAVYFLLKERRYCLPCDRWDRIECNCYAIAKHIEAMRGQNRWGVGSVEQAFAGYAALPAPTPERPWRKVFGYHATANPDHDQLKAWYRRLSRERHPDNGGSTESMAELNLAYEAAKKELGY